MYISTGRKRQFCGEYFYDNKNAISLCPHVASFEAQHLLDNDYLSRQKRQEFSMYSYIKSKRTMVEILLQHIHFAQRNRCLHDNNIGKAKYVTNVLSC